ncbi:MAG: ATP phosphoribosyltransferase regulatory subunit, partial [Thermoleophilia bacterium]|nr:ATP phosphoribosyltransferase regulatory subunit [Thermoleophilia bacterium]
TIVALSDLRGGPEVLERARALGGPAIERASTALAGTLDALAAGGVADRVRVDLGLLRDLGYYTGAIVEVYDPAVGEAIGGGGRYDDLLGRFGSPRPAAGFALNLERLHIAQAAEQEAGEGR